MALSQKELDKYLKKSKASSQISGGFGKMFRNQGRVTKFKMEKGSEQTLIIPLSIALPFNPFDLEDETFSKLNPLFMAGSVEKAWEVLHQLCDLDESGYLKEELEGTIGSTIGDAEWEMQGPELAALLKNVRKIDFKSDYTVKIDIPSFNQFGTRRRIESTVDSAGLVKYSGLLYELSRLEQALIAPEMKELNDKLKKGGELGHLTKQQKSAKRQEVASKACLGRPGLFSCFRILHIPVQDNIPSNEDAKMLATAKLYDFEKWDKIDKDKMEMYLSKLGGKYDKCPSYVEFRITVGNEDNALQLYQNAQKTIAQADPLHEVVPEFYGEYLKYRDDDEHWKDETLLKSIPELKGIDDEELLTHYENNLSGYDLSLFSSDILNKFGEIIQKVSPSKYDEIVEMVQQGLASDQVIPDDEVTALLGEEILDDDGNVDVEKTYSRPEDDEVEEEGATEKVGQELEVPQKTAVEMMQEAKSEAEAAPDLGLDLDVSGILG